MRAAALLSLLASVAPTRGLAGTSWPLRGFCFTSYIEGGFSTPDSALAFQRAAEAEFGEGLAVGRRDVDEVHAAFERGLDGGDAVVERDLAEDGAEGGGAEAENGNLKAGGAERAGFHGGGNDCRKAVRAPCRIFADA